jgi:hypothetical protein
LEVTSCNKPPKTKGKAPVSSAASEARHGEGDTSPERSAYSAPLDHTRIKLRQQNKFQPLKDERIHESGISSDKVREGSVSNANNSRGSRLAA